MHSGAEFIEFLEGIPDACDTIIFFEVVGHGTTTAKKGEPALGLELGDGDVFGIGQTMKDWDAEGDESTGHTWYGIEDYSGYLVGYLIYLP